MGWGGGGAKLVLPKVFSGVGEGGIFRYGQGKVIEDRWGL